MVKLLQNIAIVAVVLLSLTGCFKKVTTNTTLRIKVLTEEVSGGVRVPAEGCYGYLYYVDTDWSVASYEDAAAKCITNTTTGEKLSEPDVEGEPYTMEGSINNYISIAQNKPQALVVVVYPAAQMYAYMHRLSEAENLSQTYIPLIFHEWNTNTYPEGTWTVVPPTTTTSNNSFED